MGDFSLPFSFGDNFSSPRRSPSRTRSMLPVLSFPGSSSAAIANNTRRQSLTPSLSHAPGHAGRNQHVGLVSPTVSTRSHPPGVDAGYLERRRGEEEYKRRAMRKRRRGLPGAHDLENEVKRLLAACEEHERKIRQSKATIEHRMFTELPNMFGRLKEADDEAEQIVQRLQETLADTRPIVTSRTNEIISLNQLKVDELREQMSPWRGYNEDGSLLMTDEDGEDRAKEGSDDGMLEWSGGGENRLRELGITGSLARRRSSSRGAGREQNLRRRERSHEDDIDAGMARIRGWSSEVQNYLTSEIAMLRERERRRRPWYRTWSCWISTVVLICAMLIALGLARG